MRLLPGCLVLVATLLMPPGCTSKRRVDHDSRVKNAATATSQVSGGNSCVMQSGGRVALRLAVPPGTKCVGEDGSLKLTSRDRRVDLWMATGAQSVGDEVGRVSQDIKDEFKDFQTTSTSDLTIAGSPAKRLYGTGVEADDGDPGRADIIVFKAGDHIFVACTHGEHLLPVEQEWLLEVVQTAQP